MTTELKKMKKMSKTKTTTMKKQGKKTTLKKEKVSKQSLEESKGVEDRQQYISQIGLIIPEEEVNFIKEEMIKPLLFDIEVLTNKKYQPRFGLDQDLIDNIAADIEEYGFDTLIKVVREEDDYPIVSGHHRYEAAKKVGMNFIPGILLEGNELEMWEKSIKENTNRKDLTPTEKAEGLKKALDMHQSINENFSFGDLSKRLKIDKSTISRYISLLTLPKSIQVSVEQGEIAWGKAQILTSIMNDSPGQEWIASQILPSTKEKEVREWVDIWRSISTSQKADLIEKDTTWEKLSGPIIIARLAKKYEPETKKIELEAREIELEYGDQFWSPLGFSGFEWVPDEDEIIRLHKEEINDWTKANLGGIFAPYEGDNLWNHWTFCKDQAIERAALIEKLGIDYQRLDGLYDHIETYNKAHDKLEKIRKTKKISEANTKELNTIQENQIKEMIKVVEYAAQYGKHEDGLEVVKYIQTHLKYKFEFDHEMKIAAVAFELQKEFAPQIESIELEDRMANFFSIDIIPKMDYHVASRDEIFLPRTRTKMLMFVYDEFPALAAKEGYKGIEIVLTPEDKEEYSKFENIKDMYQYLKAVVFEAKMECKQKPSKVTIEYPESEKEDPTIDDEDEYKILCGGCDKDISHYKKVSDSEWMENPICNPCNKKLNKQLKKDPADFEKESRPSKEEVVIRSDGYKECSVCKGPWNYGEENPYDGKCHPCFLDLEGEKVKNEFAELTKLIEQIQDKTVRSHILNNEKHIDLIDSVNNKEYAGINAENSRARMASFKVQIDDILSEQEVRQDTEEITAEETQPDYEFMEPHLIMKYHCENCPVENFMCKVETPHNSDDCTQHECEEPVADEEEKDQPEVIGEVSEEDGIIRIDEQHYIDMSTIKKDLKSLEDNLAAKHYNTLLQIVELVKTKGDLFVKTSKKFMKYGKNGKISKTPINERVHGHLRSNVLEIIPGVDTTRSSILETKASTLQFILLITADTKAKKVEFSPHFVSGTESMKDFFDIFL